MKKKIIIICHRHNRYLIFVPLRIHLKAKLSAIRETAFNGLIK